MSFAHLHVHTDYSVDGIARIPQLFAEAERLGLSGLAITDHGTIAGVPAFLSEAVKHPSVTPIAGCEFYIESEGRLFHLILLAKSLMGYHNLVKLCSTSRPGQKDARLRINHELLEKYHEGLICSSACIGGEIPQAIIAGDYDKAREIASRYKSLFGDDFYLEVALHQGGEDVPLARVDDREAYLRSNRELVEKQLTAAEGIFKLSEELSIKVIVTNDVHFVGRDDAIAQDAFMCQSHHKRISDPKRIRYSHLEYLKSEDEMAAMFPQHPEVIDNTIDILDKVEVYSIESRPIAPHLYDNPDETLRAMVKHGAEVRFHPTVLPDGVTQRLEYELGVISRDGYSAYFIMMKQIVDNVRARGIEIGPGRGPIASSLVNYCLGITEVNPLEHGLLFERFIWPGRASYPQIDLDVEESRRDEVIDLLQELFGREHVSLVASYGKLDNTVAWDVVAKVFGIPDKERNRMRKLLIQEYMYLRYILEHSPNVRKAYDAGTPAFREAFHCADKLTGTIWEETIHHSAVALSACPINKCSPTEIVGPEDGDYTLVSQYDDWSNCGAFIINILPLRALDIVKETICRVREQQNTEVDIKGLPLDDPETLKIFSSGDTADIFQFQSEGMQEWLKEFEPRTFKDIALLNASYRPGSMDYLPSCIARRWGKEPVAYEIPGLEKILGETYGIPAYQEQLMLIGRLVGLSEEDIHGFRKWIGMKSQKYSNEKDVFINGGVCQGFPKRTMAALHDRLSKEGLYSINKSHIICYTILAWRCAWLKAHFPKEYAQAYKEAYPEG